MKLPRSNSTHTRFWCPICLFDTTLNWADRLYVLYPTFLYTAEHFLCSHDFEMNMRFSKHLAIHLSPNGTSRQCNLPQCSSKKPMKSHKYVLHLFQDHSFPLIKCTCCCDDAAAKKATKKGKAKAPTAPGKDKFTCCCGLIHTDCGNTFHTQELSVC